LVFGELRQARGRRRLGRRDRPQVAVADSVAAAVAAEAAAADAVAVAVTNMTDLKKRMSARNWPAWSTKAKEMASGTSQLMKP
jgi:hypothetical protein